MPADTEFLAGDVDFVGLAASLVMVAVALVLARWNRLGIERGIGVAVVRALVQLLGIGAVLAFILDPDRSLALSWAWVGRHAALLGGGAVAPGGRGAAAVPDRPGGVRGGSDGDARCHLRARDLPARSPGAGPAGRNDDRQLHERHRGGGPSGGRGVARQAGRSRGSPGAGSIVAAGGASLCPVGDPDCPRRPRSRRPRGWDWCSSPGP